MAGLSPIGDHGALGAAEKALIFRALGDASPERMELAIEEVELQIMFEDMLLMLLDGLAHTAIAGVETLAQLTSPEPAQRFEAPQETDR